MEWSIILGILAGTLAGIIVGSIITYFTMKHETEFGVLRIDMSDPKKDVYKLEIDNLDSLPGKKQITLKIKTEATFKGDSTRC